MAEVLFVTKRHPAGRFPECRQVVVGEFARWRSSGRLTPLVSGTDYGDGSPLVEEEGVCRPDALMSLAGRYVAYARPFCARRVCVPGGGGGGAGEASYLVARVDAKTGERLRTALRPFVDDVVVTDGGAVGWIQSPREGKGFEVLSAKDSSSFAQPTVLAAESVRGESLAVAQETVYWTEEGQPQSATIG